MVCRTETRRMSMFVAVVLALAMAMVVDTGTAAAKGGLTGTLRATVLSENAGCAIYVDVNWPHAKGSQDSLTAAVYGPSGDIFQAWPLQGIGETDNSWSSSPPAFSRYSSTLQTWSAYVRLWNSKDREIGSWRGSASLYCAP